MPPKDGNQPIRHYLDGEEIKEPDVLIVECPPERRMNIDDLPVLQFRYKLCKHCIGGRMNEIGEDIVFCEEWDCERNITLGDCFGNCEMQEFECVEVESDDRE